MHGPTIAMMIAVLSLGGVSRGASFWAPAQRDAGGFWAAAETCECGPDCRCTADHNCGCADTSRVVLPVADVLGSPPVSDELALALGDCASGSCGIGRRPLVTAASGGTQLKPLQPVRNVGRLGMRVGGRLARAWNAFRPVRRVLGWFAGRRGGCGAGGCR